MIAWGANILVFNFAMPMNEMYARNVYCAN